MVVQTKEGDIRIEFDERFCQRNGYEDMFIQGIVYFLRGWLQANMKDRSEMAVKLMFCISDMRNRFENRLTEENNN